MSTTSAWSPAMACPAADSAMTGFASSLTALTRDHSSDTAASQASSAHAGMQPG